MDKAWKAAGIFGGLAVTLFIAYINLPQNSQFEPILLVGSLVFAGLFATFGMIYIVLWLKLHLCPLVILDDDIRCTHWTTEKQLKVLLFIADYSNAKGFQVSCIAQFGTQIVSLDDKIVLDGLYMPPVDSKTKHIGSRQRMLEFYKNNITVDNTSKAKVTITIKPHGIWATQKSEKDIPVQVISRE